VAVPGKSTRKSAPWLKIAFLTVFAACGLALGVLYAFLRELPDLSLLQNEPAQSTRLYDVNGQMISQFWLEQRTLIPLSKVPQNLQDAVLATEDVRFYKHWGIDFLGVFRAFLMNIKAGRVVEGGSTITQQLARNLFLSRDQTLSRKVREALLSLQIERNFTKKQILEMYLNQIYFGQGAYGVESASRTYFGKHAQDMTLAECAMLAGMPKAPTNYDPYKNPLAALQRRNKVLNNMAEEGFITLQEATNAKNQPLELRKIEVQTAPYFVEYVRQQLEAKYGTHTVYKGGLAVYTTLDLKIQEDAQRALTRGLQDAENVSRRTRPGGIPVNQPIQGAMLVMDPKTGAIRAMIGGRDFRESVFNRAVQAERQPGSSFKPIIYAAAIENGYTFADVFLDSPAVYADPGTGKEWRPANFSGKFRGPTTLHTALMYSINMVTIKLLEKLGIQPVVNLARRMGISTPIKPNLSLGLGTSEATLTEMCAAFNVFDNQGIRVGRFRSGFGKQLPRRPRSAGPPNGLSRHAHLEGCHRPRNRANRPPFGLQPPCGRQDRNLQQQYRRLVHRLHAGSFVRRVGGLRRAPKPGSPPNGRYDRRPHLGGLHEIRHRRHTRQGLPRAGWIGIQKNLYGQRPLGDIALFPNPHRTF
jgi:penicillin-binding protein 1A